MTLVMDVKDYREVIRNKRKKLGWSQYRLAKEIGIAQSFMNEIEKGRKTPSLDVFFRICDPLDIRLFLDEE